MRSGSLTELAPWAIAVAVPVVAFVTLLANPALDPILQSANGHFYIVSGVSLICVALGLSGRASGTLALIPHQRPRTLRRWAP